MTNADRAAAEVRFRDVHGCGVKDSALAARALHPFDDDAEPGDRFGAEGRQLAKRFGKDVAPLRGNEVAVVAERAIEEMLDLARDHREMYYVSLFERVLESTTGPVAAPEPGE